MIYEEHGLTTEIAFNSVLKKAGIKITSYVAPIEITTDVICTVDTTKHDEEIRAEERRKVLHEQRALDVNLQISAEELRADERQKFAEKIKREFEYYYRGNVSKKRLRRILLDMLEKEQK